MKQSYIALLRGINVGGKNRLPMEVLRKLCAELGWDNVRTYIQSGNVVFVTEKAEPSLLAESLMQKLQEEMSKPIPVLVISHAELQQIVENNPFVKESDGNPEILHVTLLQDAPSQMQTAAIDPQAFLPDEFRVIGRALYLKLPNGVSNSKLTFPFFEKKFQTLSTSRNWRTMQTLVKMGSQ